MPAVSTLSVESVDLLQLRSVASVGEVKHRTTGFRAVIACALTALAGPCVAW